MCIRDTIMRIRTSPYNMFNQWIEEEEKYISNCPYETIDVLKIALHNAVTIPLRVDTQLYSRKDRIFFLHLSFNLLKKLIHTDSRFQTQQIYKNIIDRYDNLMMDMKNDKRYHNEASYMEYRFLPLYQQCKHKVQHDTVSRNNSQSDSYTSSTVVSLNM